MTSSSDSPNPYAPTTELSEVSAKDLEKEIKTLLWHANRVWLSLIGLVFLGLLGPIVYTLVFLHQTRECDRLAEADPATDSAFAPRLRKARAKFSAAAQLYGILLVAEIIYFGSVIFLM
ncbi:MAG: hypothetical protein AAFX06_04435 [Planctomycetota bacterium]